MDKYLLEILKNVNTIIIPGLGALTITNHDTGEIMFMSYLKHDDGKLVSYIMENEGLEELEAKNLIAKYVREIELTVGKGDSYDMFQFGSFYKNGDDIDFKNWDQSSPSPIEKKKPVAKKEEVKPEEKSPELENVLVEKTKKDEPKVEKEVEKVAPKVDPEKVETKKKELNVQEKEEQLKHAEKLAVLKKTQEDKKSQKTKKPVKEKGEKSKKGVGFWMLMGILVLIVAGGTYFGLNYDELKQHIPFLADKEEVVNNDESVDENDDDVSSDDNSANNESDVESEEEVLPEEDDVDLVEDEVLPVEPTVVASEPKDYSGSDLPFHVIAGAFSSEENARRLGDKFASEGYSVKVAPGKGMNLVSIKSFSTREEAQKGLNELKGVAPNGWIYEWK